MTEEYKVYLDSNEWQRRRKKRLDMDNCTCQLCGCADLERLQVHHITYKHTFCEDPETDLITLCDPCHTALTEAIKEWNTSNHRFAAQYATEMLTFLRTSEEAQQITERYYANVTRSALPHLCDVDNRIPKTKRKLLRQLFFAQARKPQDTIRFSATDTTKPKTTFNLRIIQELNKTKGNGSNAVSEDMSNE